MTTPMRITKNWFKNIDTMLRSRNPSARIVNLCRTKHTETVIDRFEKKPVNCDFVRIYISDEGQFSFGIEFDYMDKEAKDWKLRFSVGLRSFERGGRVNNHPRYDVKHLDWISFKDFNSKVAQKTSFEGNTVEDLCKYLTGPSLHFV